MRKKDSFGVVGVMEASRVSRFLMVVVGLLSVFMRSLLARLGGWHDALQSR